MADAAKVTSIDGIREFREALGSFIEDARNALTAVEMENRRVNEWVKNTQRLYWLNEVKRRREKMNEIRGELHRRKLSGAGDTEAKEQVRIANARLRVAEEKVEVVKKAAPSSSTPSTNTSAWPGPWATCSPATSSTPWPCSSGWPTPSTPTSGPPPSRTT